MFCAAFLAGAAAAVGLNRTLDVHLAQRQPRVESEPIFIALRSLPSGAPVTVWDVALRDWPKAMLPAAAMRPRDSFEGLVLRHPLREGQPILSVQLVKAAGESDAQLAETVPAATLPDPIAPDTQSTPSDLWAPAEAAPAPTVSQADAIPEPPSIAQADTETRPAAEPVPTAQPTVAEPVVAEPLVVSAPATTDIDPSIASVGNATMPQQAPVVRYLVVPERIALEADRSFVPAADALPVTDVAPETTAEAAPPQSPVQQGRVTKSSERTSSSRDRQAPRPPRSASGQPVPASSREAAAWSLRSMMPRLSLGMGAVEPAPQSKGQPAQATQPGPAVRGFGLFR